MSRISPSPAQEAAEPAVDPNPRSAPPALRITTCAVLAVGTEIRLLVFASLEMVEELTTPVTQVQDW